MKKLVSLVLALAMILSMTAFAQVAETEASWRAKAVETVQDLDIMRGDENGDMKLNDYLTRQEMFAIMYRLYAAVGVMDATEQAKWNMFAGAVGTYVGDMDSVSFWAVPYASYNWIKNIFVGDLNGNLNPLANLSYLECATVLLRALGYDNALLTANGTWALNVLQYGMEAGLWEFISVTDFTAPITRAHIAVMIYNALQAQTVTCTTSNGVTTYEFDEDEEENPITLIEDNFGFSGVDSIVSGGLVLAYYDADKEIFFVNEDEEYEGWLDASDIGVTNAALPGFYGEYITWVAKEDGTVLRAAEVEDLGWDTFSYKGSAGATIGAKGYKADGTTEVDYDDALCAYVKVTTGGTTYVVPKTKAFQSYNEVMLAYPYMSGEDFGTIVDCVGYTYYSSETNTVRYADLGGGKGYVFFENDYLWFEVFDKSTSTYTVTNGKGYITINGSSSYLVSGNLISGLETGDVIVIDYDYLYYDSIPVIYSVTKLAKTSVNGGMLTASYVSPDWTNVKYNGSAIGLTNGLSANDLSALYALPTAKNNGDPLGYIYVLDGYIVGYSTATYSTTTPPVVSDDYYLYVTAAPTFTFDGGLMIASVTGNINGVSTTVNITLPNALVLGSGYTVAEASAALAAGNLVKVDPLSATVAATGQKVDQFTDVAAGIGYVYRWINLEFNGINETVAVGAIGLVEEVPTLFNGTIDLSNESIVFYQGALIEDNADVSTVEGNTIASLIGDNDIDTMSEICKTMYYTYTNADEDQVAVFLANADFDSDERALWDSGVTPDSTSEYFYYISAAAGIELQPNGDIVVTADGYIKGIKTAKTLTFKSGTTTASALAGKFSAGTLLDVTYNETTGYIDGCDVTAGENDNSGYVIRYVNETFEELNTQIKTSYGTTILTTASDQVMVGIYAEERIETLATALAAFNAANSKSYTLAQLAKTAVLQYTAGGKTYVVFSANSYNAAKRTEFDNWIAANPDWAD